MGAMAGVTTWVLKGKRPRPVAVRMAQVYRRQLRLLATAVERAARGDEDGAEEYVSGWYELGASVLERLRVSHPDAVLKSATGELLVVAAEREPIEVTPERILLAASLAPVSAWVAMEGLPRGLGLALLAEIRELIPHATPLTPTPGLCIHWQSAERVRTALSLIGRAVTARIGAGSASDRGGAALRRVMEVLALDRTETARLFGVTRQALEHWRRHGVPADRQQKLTAILSIAELLEKHLRPGVVPGVVRTPAPAYGERTMLELMEADEHRRLLESVRSSFDWAASA
jgi:hypothetical protein